jgi:hypothetical protein
MEKVAAGCKRILVLLPRGHMKTHYFGIATMLWRLINNPEDRILYIMSSTKQAEKSIESLEKILISSKAMHHFFPLRVLDLGDPRMRGTASVIRLAREGNYREESIEARGIKSRVTGGHFNRHIFDDLIDETMMDSETLQEKSVRFVECAEPLFVNPGKDDRIIIGTRWPGPFYNWLLEPGGIADTYEKLVLGCYVDHRYHQFLESVGKRTTLNDGDPIWKDNDDGRGGFTTKSLEDIKAVSNFMFAHQYLNVEVSDADRRFRNEDIRYYAMGVNKWGEPSVIVTVGDEELAIPIASLYRTLTIDPATGEHSKTDESAISVCGHCRKHGLMFVLEDWAGRVQPFDLIDKIIVMSEKWNPHVVAPEDVSFQKTFKFFLKQEMTRRGVHFPIRPVKPGNKSKGARISAALQPYVQSHQLHFLKSQWQLIRELINMQVINGKVIGKSPNRIDSLSYHPEFWRGGPAFQSDVDEDDLDYFDAYKIDTGAAYGLECVT